HDLGRTIGYQVKAFAHVFTAGHLRHMEAHGSHFEHVAAAHRVPRVHHAVVTEGAGDAVFQHFRNARHTATLGIGVVTTLNNDVDQRVCCRAHIGFSHEGQELGHIVIVHGVHGS